VELAHFKTTTVHRFRKNEDSELREELLKMKPIAVGLTGAPAVKAKSPAKRTPKSPTVAAAAASRSRSDRKKRT
jgi:hypothetical protein